MAQKHSSTTTTTTTMLLLIIIAFHLSSLITISTAQPLNAMTDESILLSIKSFITSDPNNIITTNWSQGTSFCTWTGITCSPRHQRVTALNLFDFELTGTISPQIGNLSFLTYLDIRNNSFTDMIPDTLGNLFRLRELRMSDNQLSGSIPPSLGLLRNLEIMDLADNNLRGNVPWGIFNITSIRVIAFTKNQQLTGNLPPEICPPSSRLQELRLSRNKFSGEIPRGWSNCAELRNISLSVNNFSGNLQMEIGNLPQLQILALGDNLLTGSIPPSVGNLSNLGMLDLSRNGFEGTIPSEMGSLSSLTFLNLGFNRLNGELPPSIFNLTRIQTLALTSNELSGTIPPSIDMSIPNLQILYLGGNKFSGEIPITIANLSLLTLFDIGINFFTGPFPITLGNLHQLQTLRIGENQFTNDISIPEQDFLTSLTNCRNLTILRISGNPITGALPISVGNLSASLQQFLASSCRLSGRIPREIGNLSSLYYLALARNYLTAEIPTTLGNLRNLQALLLFKNNLHGSLPASLCSLENLFQANFEYNNLSGQLPRCIGNLTSLQQLYLSNNSFNSTIPSTMWSNTRIQVLSLSRNQFDGSLPNELGNLKNLQRLYLNGNHFSGNIPDAISNLQGLTTLELQNNMLNGSIPPSFAHLYALEHLDLSQNNLSGPIPMSLENIVYLNYFNVSFNELSGEIPHGGHFGNFSSGFFIGNRGLCGPTRFGVEPCNTTNSSRRNDRIHTLLRYVLPSIASVIVVAVFILLLLRCYHRRKRATTPITDSPLGFTHERISYYEILRATNNLDIGNLIGKGSIGSVYHGVFSNQMVAVVKVFNLEVHGAFKSFDIECGILRCIRHRNLVKIITSCSNHEFKALVMEYMPNGNLEKWLHSPDCELNFDQRLKIMIDVGSAIEYLHHGYYNTIVHCDLKPSNILLDEDMVAHVGDFGIAKLLMENQRTDLTKTLGTIGYMAPEYGSSGIVSTTADIYSYGIMLMEIFTGKKPTDDLFLEELPMKIWVHESYPSNTMQIIDDKLLNADDGYNSSNIEECVKSIVELALQCTEDAPDNRPNMHDVLVRLKKIHAKLDKQYY